MTAHRQPTHRQPTHRLTLDIPETMYSDLLADAARASTSLRDEVLKGIAERRFWQALRRAGDRVTITPADPMDPPYDLRVITI